MRTNAALLVAAATLAACAAASTPDPAVQPEPQMTPQRPAAPPPSPPVAAAPAKTPDPPPPGAAVAQKLADMARAESQAFETVRSLVDEVGPRLSGSPGDKAGVAWAVAAMKAKGLANVRAEKVMVPRWERGQESGRIVSPTPHTLSITALGGTVGTPARGIEGEVVMVDSLEAIDKLEETKLKGKILFVSARTERRQDGRGYGKTAGVRSRSAVAAAKKGAIAVVIRSIGTDHDRMPHTGAMRYEKGVKEIPAAAVSIPDADLIERLVSAGKPVRLAMTLGAKTLPDAESANVIGEVVGREKPDEIVLIGAHLDSWDLGFGAVDDGAGCAAVMEAARLISKLPERPRRTVRVVLFANEENGLKGAFGYAKEHAAEIDKHLLAFEADAGAGRVLSIRFLAPAEAMPKLAFIPKLVEPLGVKRADEDAHGGADLIPLREAGVPLVDLLQDMESYFDVHHTPNDTLAQVKKEEIDHMVASIAIVAHAAADLPEAIGKLPEEKRKWR
ncbi:M20/M25/M40 family metallo-hydrolase [Polyangium aurulentum]|uniref:M20/M25/M40 family metallo-hydrolase n=1 Tax=Polyangium aurulentum TaxID=2567896 RepID=UPI0010AE4996|nr:M20/M25/M40 family metallo-hydrolase [Polyangium aurulentum]UQA62839.1 M20/M25/M40 family metallo-hydrolase [Polyangium aurulentum]